MAGGRILAQGTSTALKKEFGSGYSLRIICKDAEEVKRQLMGVGVKGEVEEGDVVVSMEGEGGLVGVLEYLEKEGGKGGISEWLISESTLEDVFLSVNKRY